MVGEPAHASQEGQSAEVEVDAAMEKEMAELATTPPYPSLAKDNSELIVSLLDYNRKEETTQPKVTLRVVPH